VANPVNPIDPVRWKWDFRPESG